MLNESRAAHIHISKLFYSSFADSIYIVSEGSQFELPAPLTSSVVHGCWGGEVILG